MRSVALALLCAAACSGDDGVHHLPDAPPAPEAGVDAATSGPVTLTVTNLGAPVAGVTVHFQNADSSLVLTTMTDATGTATATMDAGGYVTAMSPFPAAGLLGVFPTDIRTFAGVKPGDHLVLSNQASPTTLSFVVQAPIDDVAVEYKLYTSCSAGNAADIFGSGSGFAPQFNVFVDGCATVDFGVVTFDANGAPVHAFYHPNVAVQDDTTVTLTDAYGTPTAFTINYANAPAGTTSLQMNHFLASPAGAMMRTILGTDVTGGTASLSFPQPPLTAPIAVVSTTLEPSGIGTQTVIDWGAQANPTTIDLAGTTLPPYASVPVVDAASHMLTWTTTAGTAQPDFAIADFEVDRSSSQTFWFWEIAAPATASSSITLPVLPGADAMFDVAASDMVFVNNLITAKVPGGYDAVRSNVLSIGSAEGLVTGASGRALVEDMRLTSLVRLANPWHHARHVFGRR